MRFQRDGVFAFGGEFRLQLLHQAFQPQHFQFQLGDVLAAMPRAMPLRDGSAWVAASAGGRGCNGLAAAQAPVVRGQERRAGAENGCGRMTGGRTCGNTQLELWQLGRGKMLLSAAAAFAGAPQDRG